MPNISEQMIHLGLGGTAVPQPPFTGMEWYGDYAERVADDGDEGRLVTMGEFQAGRWEHWEMHPNGSEVVMCIAGEMTLEQELTDGQRVSTVLGPGDYIINDPGVWHIAEAAVATTALFITSGRGTEHRPA